MIICHDFYIRGELPKFLDKTLEKFKLVEGKGFLEESDLRDFVYQLRWQLEKDMPVEENYHIVYSVDGGYVSLENAKGTKPICAWFDFSEFDGFLHNEPGINGGMWGRYVIQPFRDEGGRFCVNVSFIYV